MQTATPLWQCLVAILIAFVFWVWALFNWLKWSRAHETLHGQGFVEQLGKWAKTVKQEASTSGKVLLVLGGVFLKVCDVVVTFARGSITAGLIAVGPAGITAVGSVCAPPEWIPDAIRELRKLLESVGRIRLTYR